MSNLDDELSRLAKQYGAGEFKAAAKKAVSRATTKGRRGRPPHDDAETLRPQTEHDAMLWAMGQDPKAYASDHAVAEDFASIQSGHSPDATKRRIRRKLSNARLMSALRYLSDLANARQVIEHYAPPFHKIEERATALGVHLSPSADDDELATCLAECARRALES